MAVEKNPNVFIDTAAYLYEINEIITENLISRIGEDKIIFSTDYPMPSPPHTVHNMKAFVEEIKQLPLPSDTKEKIFSKNFNKMISPPICESKESIKLKDMIK